MSPERLSELLPKLHATCDDHDRDPHTLPVYCRGGRGTDGINAIRRYEALGVHSLQVEIATFDDLKRFADEVLPHF
jgi:hypothetical protein